MFGKVAIQHLEPIKLKYSARKSQVESALWQETLGEKLRPFIRGLSVCGPRVHLLRPFLWASGALGRINVGREDRALWREPDLCRGSEL